MTASVRPLDSAAEQARELGAFMESAQVLDVVERLHSAAQHPDIVLVKRYGRDEKPGGKSPAGVSLKYQSGSEAYIWAATAEAAVPADLAPEVASRRIRGPHTIRLLLRLFDVAQPELFTAWRTVAFPDLGLSQVCGIELNGADGSIFVLRVTSGSGPTDPDGDPFPDYVIPEGVRTCLREADVQSAARG